MSVRGIFPRDEMSRGDVWLSRALIMFDLALNLSIAMGTFSYTFSVPFTNMTAIYCYLKLLRFTARRICIARTMPYDHPSVLPSVCPFVLPYQIWCKYLYPMRSY